MSQSSVFIALKLFKPYIKIHFNITPNHVQTVPFLHVS